MAASSHIIDVRFDAQGLVANAGLVLPATLAQHLGLPELLRQHVHLGRAELTEAQRFRSGAIDFLKNARQAPHRAVLTHHPLPQGVLKVLHVRAL